MLAEQAEGQVSGGVPSGLARLREELCRNKASADNMFRVQDTEMCQLQETMTKVQAQARRSAAVTADKAQESESTLVDLVRETLITLKQLLDATHVPKSFSTARRDMFTTSLMTSTRQSSVSIGKSKDIPTRSGG